jgi:hypothetical protein
MANTREPIVQPIPILSLRPTQMTVGMREVNAGFGEKQGRGLFAGLVRTNLGRLGRVLIKREMSAFGG